MKDIVLLTLIICFIIVFICGTVEIETRDFKFRWPGIIAIVFDKIIKK